LCRHKFHKIENYFIFEMLKKINWGNFQRIKEFFKPKIVSNLSKLWVWDPGSGKNLFPDPGVKKAPDPGSGSATLLSDGRIRIRRNNYESEAGRTQKNMDPEHCQLFLCWDAQCCLILAGGFSRLFGCRSGEAWPGGASLQQCARATET
jgi:hypothetical protein